MDSVAEHPPCPACAACPNPAPCPACKKVDAVYYSMLHRIERGRPGSFAGAAFVHRGGKWYQILNVFPDNWQGPSAEPKDDFQTADAQFAHVRAHPADVGFKTIDGSEYRQHGLLLAMYTSEEEAAQLTDSAVEKLARFLFQVSPEHVEPESLLERLRGSMRVDLILLWMRSHTKTDPNAKRLHALLAAMPSVERAARKRGTVSPSLVAQALTGLLHGQTLHSVRNLATKHSKSARAAEHAPLPEKLPDPGITPAGSLNLPASEPKTSAAVRAPRSSPIKDHPE